MAVDWPPQPLGKLVQNFDSRRVPLSSREREKRRGRFPYHGATGVMDYIDDFLFEGLHLLVGEDGSVETTDGNPFLQLVDGRFWVNNHAHVLKGKTDVETWFIYYALSTVAIRPFMSGSVQAKLSQGNLNRIPISYPPQESTRLAITHILGTLDDKIGLNRRMNATLEAMARALFQSWFVDFDPVRQNMDAKPAPSLIPESANGLWFTYAIECQGGSLYIGQTDDLRRRWKQHVDGKGAEWTKAHPPVALGFWEAHDSLEAAVAREAKLKSGSGREWLKQKIAERTSVRLPAGEAGAKLDGRPPSALDPATAALFPEHLEDSPLGHIPKGWKAGTVVEGFNLTMGQSPPGDTYNEEGNGLPFYQGRTDFGFRFPTRRIYCSAPTRYAKPGDTLVSVRAPVGDINMANEECCIGRGVAAVRHKSGATSFTYHSMANLYPDFARFEAEGTVFGSINKDSFEKLRFVIPPDEIVAAYERQAGPLDEQIRTLENQSRTLATLRDTLLPKLLSGELSAAGTVAKSATVQTGKETRP